jgi:hypothetical protein
MLVRRAVIRAGVQQQLLLRAVVTQRVENQKELLKQQKAGLRLKSVVAKRTRSILEIGPTAAVEDAAPVFIQQLPTAVWAATPSAARQLPLPSPAV